MANLMYNKLKWGLLADNINLSTDTLKVMLVTSAYSPVATHNFKSDVTNEVTGTGYTAGGITLVNKSFTEDDTNNLGYFDADNVAWLNSTITARGAVIYKDTGVASTSPIIAYYDFVTDKSSSASDFTLQWNSGGLIAIA